MSDRRSNDGIPLEVESSTAGATSHRDLGGEMGKVSHLPWYGIVVLFIWALIVIAGSAFAITYFAAR